MNQDNFKKNKSFLIRYRNSVEKRKRLEEKLIDLNERLVSLQSPVISDMPRGQSSPLTLDDLLVRKEELEQRIEHEYKKGQKIRKQIYDKIDQLEDVRYCEVLESYFLDCKSFEEVSEEFSYSYVHTNRLYAAGVRKLKLHDD